MSVGLNPIPLAAMKDLPSIVQEYLRQLRNVIQQGSGSIPWSSLNFSGSNITDIAVRLHNSLQSIQGGSVGSRFHLTRALTGSKTIALGSVGSLTNVTTTITVTGAVVGDSVILNPSSTLEAGISMSSYVSASNTITIVATNASAGAIVMASRTYNVMVLAP